MVMKRFVASDHYLFGNPFACVRNRQKGREIRVNKPRQSKTHGRAHDGESIV
jgi:hypothetical protein